MIPSDPLVRLMSYVKRTSRGCWLWAGTCNKNGYGHFVMDTAGRKKIAYPTLRVWQQSTAERPTSSADILFAKRTPTGIGEGGNKGGVGAG